MFFLQGCFQEENFKDAMADLEQSHEANHPDLLKIVRELAKLPVIVFSFSQKEFEFYAKQFKAFDFNTNLEMKSNVLELFNTAMMALSEEQRELTQVNQVLSLLQRGIGIHHEGLLPILKNTVEIFFFF